MEEITGCNLKIMLFAKFVKFFIGILNSIKPDVNSLLSVAAADVRSFTGSNLMSILRNTGVVVTPGVTKAATIKKQTLFPVPEAQELKVLLLHSLLAV